MVILFKNGHRIIISQKEMKDNMAVMIDPINNTKWKWFGDNYVFMDEVCAFYNVKNEIKDSIWTTTPIGKSNSTATNI